MMTGVDRKGCAALGGFAGLPAVLALPFLLPPFLAATTTTLRDRCGRIGWKTRGRVDRGPTDTAALLRIAPGFIRFGNFPEV
jgi:hypothetical protein